MNNKNIRLFTIWSVPQILLALGAVGVVVWKLREGLGAVTNLSDIWPWGLWVAFDMGVYIPLAGGGFALAAIVYIFQLERFRPIIKPAILAAMLLYTIGAIGIFVDIGKSINIIHPIWMWNPYSVLFEVSWCVMLYVSVLYLEFSPNVFQRFKRETLIRLQHYILIPLVIIGVILSFLHQSSLGSMLLITVDQHPLWHSPLMGYLFLISAIAAGLAMVIFVSIVTAKVWKFTLRMDVLSRLGKVVAWVLAVYLVIRLTELFVTGNISAFEFDEFGLLFLAEVGVGLALPMLLLFFSRVRKSPALLLTSVSLVFIGLMLNRVSAFIISHAPSRVGNYIPAWSEILLTVGLLAGVMYAYRLAAKYLPVYSDELAGLPDEVKETKPDVVSA